MTQFDQEILATFKTIGFGVLTLWAVEIAVSLRGRNR